MIDKLYYWILHRFVPKYQYNKIHIKSLEPGYYDPDIRMLHGCFDLFTEWFHYNVFEAKLMDRETIDETNVGMYDEMMTLYKWWTVTKPEWDMRDDLIYSDIEKFEEVEDEMLSRLMKIRRSIWYL